LPTWLATKFREKLHWKKYENCHWKKLVANFVGYYLFGQKLHWKKFENCHEILAMDEFL